MKGRLHTRYAPVRRFLPPKGLLPRLACVRPAASVHPEPGSNSSSLKSLISYRLNWLSLKQFKSSCAVSLFLMNLSSFFFAFSKRVQIYNIFFNLQMFLKKFLFFIFSLNLLRFSKRVQNYNFFSKLPNLFSIFFHLFFFASYIPSHFAVAKVILFYPIIQMFYKLFLKYFILYWLLDN